MSPDGERSVSTSSGPPSVWALMLVSLSRSSQAIREPREVDINQTLVGGGLGQIAWSADGREIIYAAGWGLLFLWRIAPSENLRRSADVCRGSRRSADHISKRLSTGVFPFTRRVEHLVAGARRRRARERPARTSLRFLEASSVLPFRRMERAWRSSRIAPQHRGLDLPQQRFRLFTGRAARWSAHGKPGMVSG